MTKAQQRAETAALVRKARYGKRKLAITRCLPGQERNYTPKHGGVCPGHLNPVTMR